MFFIDNKIHHTLFTLTENSQIAISSYNTPSFINYIPVNLKYLNDCSCFDFYCSYAELGLIQKNTYYLFNIGITFSDENKKNTKVSSSYFWKR